jgi:hypothetical protein
MNKHILLVMKWLNDKDSVTQEELKDNRTAAADAAADAYAADAYAAAAAADAYAADAYAADAYAADAYAADAAEKWVTKYFEQTCENKQDYIDALAAKAEPVFTQEMADNGVLPSVGMEVELVVFENLTSLGHIEFKNEVGFLFRYKENNLCDFMEFSSDIAFKPLTPPITLIDKALNDMVEQLTNEGIVTYDPIMLRILIEKFKNNKISGIKWTDNE